MQQKSTPRKQDAPHSQPLALMDEKAFREKGYNPYDSVIHVKDTRDRDVWRNKPKRA